MLFATDTHALVHHVVGQSRKLGRRARAVFDRVERGLDTLLIPFTVLEEVMRLSEVGKVHLPMPFRDLLVSFMRAENFELGVNDPELLLEAAALTGIKDPYDRLIVAQARVAGLPLVTGDEAIHDSRLVRTVWD
jgi:PIN domain nuclease of toxin-antitoxin system